MDEETTAERGAKPLLQVTVMQNFNSILLNLSQVNNSLVGVRTLEQCPVQYSQYGIKIGLI